MENLPKHVEQDLADGFIMTDIDDGFQRCKKLSDTVFTYRCDVNGEVHEETIDVDTIDDKDDAVGGYYASYEALIVECDGDMESVNMLVAECHFEYNCPIQLPTEE